MILSAFIALAGYASFEVQANAGGVSGKTLKNGNGCTCHDQNNNTSVTIATSATTFYTGQTYTFTVTVANSNQAGAGFNAAVDRGTLNAGTNSKKVGTELTHDPKQIGLPVTWTFTYTAPSTTGEDKIYATGNAINNNGGNSGDQWNHGSTYTFNVVAPPTKLIALSKTSMNLGSVRVGQNRSDTMRIFSYGDENLTITSSAMKNTTPFSASPTGTNRTINTGSNEVNTITFAPTTKGSFVDTFVINNNSTVASDVRKTVVITGTGIQGVFSGGTSLAFGDVEVNSSKRMGYVFTNTGDDTLFVNNATISGSGYTIVSQPTDLSLAPNQKDSVVVELAATAKQTYSGSLTITAQGGVSVPSISLAGNGVAAGITAPALTDMGGIRVGLVNQGTVTVTNTGNDTLRITAAQITAGATSRFSVSGFSPVNVLPNQSTAININYTADDQLADTATLTLTSNALNQPTLNVKVFATGTMPAMALTEGQDTLRFAAVRTGKTASLTFNIRNTGTDVLAISKVQVAAPFSVEDRPTTIEAKSQGTVTITFSPTATGVFTGMIVIAGDDPANPSDTVYVVGTGVNSALNVPSTLDFGSTAPNVEVIRDLILTNEGTAPVIVYSYKLSGPSAASFRLVDTSAHTIGANASVTVRVGFDPAAAGTFTASLDIAVDDNTAPVRTVVLSGTAVQGQLQIDPASIDFGVVDSGTVSDERFVVIRNTGTAPVTISTVDFPCIEEFIPNAAGVVGSLAAGDSVTVGVRYAPKNRGVDNCTVTITPSEGSNLIIQLTGTGRGTDVKSVKANSPIADFGLRISPNPVSGTAMISLSMKRGADVQFDVYDINGRIVSQISNRYLPFGEHAISLSTLGMSNGEYFVIATSEGAIAGDAKIVVQR